MLKARDIIYKMDKLAPKHLIDSWDNTGFQIGNEDIEVKKILLALDIDSRVINRAIEGNYNMVISHHPIIFSPLKSVNTNSPKGKLIYDMIRNDIVGYNAHSNLDQAKNGINTVLGDLFNLENRKFIEENEEYQDYGYGVVGDVEEKTVLEYVDISKEKLDTSRVTIYGDLNKKVKKLALSGGSGASFIYPAYKKGADLYITGDIKYHDAQMAVELGMVIIDGGHYHTEKVILPKLKEYILSSFKDSEIEVDIFKGPSPEYKIL